jgi:2-oxoglutarate ferredoxin oxidoreductase subunit alpha
LTGQVFCRVDIFICGFDMAERVLLKGNEAMVEGAIEAGCRFFAGYPITPQNVVPELMSRRMVEAGGVFIQAESELAAINMIFGAASTGTRCMTSSSSPGISLKQEGISYIAGAELPCVIANIQRGGPGLGNIRASQGDYFQAVKGGGHGDYRLIVLTPGSVGEMYDFTMRAFDYADLYRNPVMILSDGIIGQMAEPFEAKKYDPICELPDKDWVLGDCEDREPRVVKTLMLGSPDALAEHNRMLDKKYKRIEQELQLWEELYIQDCDVVIAAYGSSGRIASGAVDICRAKGIKAGLVRPQAVWPFPKKVFEKLEKMNKTILVVEMSNGQFVDDVRAATHYNLPVEFMGLGGGWYPSPEMIFERVEQMVSAKL